MATTNPRNCYVCGLPPEGHNQRTAHTFVSDEDVQRALNKHERDRFWADFDRPPLLWCDECHCWHAHASHCPYHPAYAGAGA